MKKKKPFNPSHRLVKQVNGIPLNEKERWILHLICQFKCVFISTGKGMNSAKTIEPKLGYILSLEEMVESINVLMNRGYVKGIEKKKEFGSLRVNFEVNTFAIQNEYEDQYEMPELAIQTPSTEEPSPF